MNAVYLDIQYLYHEVGKVDYGKLLTCADGTTIEAIGYYDQRFYRYQGAFFQVLRQKGYTLAKLDRFVMARNMLESKATTLYAAGYGLKRFVHLVDKKVHIIDKSFALEHLLVMPDTKGDDLGTT